MLKYVVYKCYDGNNKYNTLYNIYFHDMMNGDYYLATFRRINDLKKFVEALGVENDEIYYSNVMRKDMEIKI